ncbi:MAG: helical backbone metal receptor, partial [Cellulosilyticum sp.]|nr:helical backbone metal receptor [Cellulosilyticum sp.]
MKRLLKRQHVKLIMLIMMLLTMLVGCTSNKDIVEETKTESFNVSIIDSTGETITLSSEPQRIVSLAPGITEILYYLGIEDKIVGRTDYCNFPENIKEVPSVGDSNNFNLEAIIALEPDLVIGATYIPQDTMDKLREMGIKLAFLNEQESFEGTFAAIDKVGKLVNREAEATDIVVGMQNKIDDTVEAVEALGKTEKPKVYYMVGYGQQDFTAGGDTFIG